MSSDHIATPSARILERVREDATDLALLATVTTHGWKLLSDRNGTQMHEMTGESLSSKVSTVRTFGTGGGGHPSEFYLVRAATTVRADVSTMLDVLRTNTSKDFRAVMKKIFGRQFESGAIVDSLSCTAPPPHTPDTHSREGSKNWQCSSEDDGYNANWITLRAFTKLGGLDGQRDFTMVCYQDVFERAHISDKLIRKGRRVARDPRRSMTSSGLIGVHTFSSMNFKDIPELPKSSKIDRLHFRNSGIVIEELVEQDADGPLVRVSILLSLMPSKLVLKELSQSPRMRVALTAGHEVLKKYRKWLQTLALGVRHLAEAAKPIVTMQHLSSMTWTKSSRCFLCLKTFRTFRKQHHCRLCAEAVCTSCSSIVDMSLFDVSYKEAEGSSEDSTVEHRKINLLAISNEKREHTSQNGNSEEYLEIRGCTMCTSELQMKLAIHSQSDSVQGPILDDSSSNDSLSQLTSSHLGSRGEEHGFDRNSGYSSIHGPMLPYPDQENDFERDRVMSGYGSDFLQRQRCSSQTTSFSNLSHDECDQLTRYLTSSAELMVKASCMSNSRLASSCLSTSDASLSDFLARDPDIVSLDELTFSSGDSVTQSSDMIAVIDGEERMDLAYKLGSKPDIRSSYATTAATNEESNHSQSNYLGMTQRDIRAAEHSIYKAKIRETQRMNARRPLHFRHHEHSCQPDYEQSLVKIDEKLYYTPLPEGRLSSSRSLTSSSSTHSDLIQFIAPIKAPVTSSTGFVVFDGSQQTEILHRDKGANDMIPLAL